MRGWWPLVAANTVVAAASGAFGILALVRPGALMGWVVEVGPSSTHFAAMYAVRAVPLALAVIAVAWRARPGTPGALMLVLAVAGAVQLGDVVVAVAESTPGAVGACVAAIVHLGSLALLVRRRHRMDATNRTASFASRSRRS